MSMDRLLVLHTPPPWDYQEAAAPSPARGAGHVPMGVLWAGNIPRRIGFFSSRNPAGFVYSFDTGHAAETLQLPAPL